MSLSTSIAAIPLSEGNPEGVERMHWIPAFAGAGHPGMTVVGNQYLTQKALWLVVHRPK